MKTPGSLSGWFRKAASHFPKKKKSLQPRYIPQTVTFTGGLGAQIFSLAIVHALSMRNIDVAVDLSYFNMTPRVAKPGEAHSIWDWQLGPMGIEFDQIEKLATAAPGELEVLEDSPAKFSLGIHALLNPDIQDKFSEPKEEASLEALNLGTNIFASPFIAIHLRRGDYLNVSSHVVPDADYLELVKDLAGIADTIAIASDSKVNKRLRDAAEKNFRTAVFLDNPDFEPVAVHHVLRRAAIHVGSNGQFSLTAGILGSGFFLRPTHWFGQDSGFDHVLEGLSRNSFTSLRNRAPQKP